MSKGSLLGTDSSVSLDANYLLKEKVLAFKPRFYPILQRVRYKKSLRNVEIASGSIPTRYRKIMKANWYIKSTKTDNPTWLNHSSTVNFGNTTQSKTNNPGWRQVVAVGGNATYTYARTVRSFKPAKYTCQSESTAYSSNGFGQIHGSMFIVPGDFAPLRDKALASLKHKLDGNIGKAQLAAPIAESREIGRLVRQINKLGIDVVKAGLAIRKTRGKSALKQFGDIWLGFGFGVNPLLKDIESAANSILDYTTREDRHVRVIGTATNEWTTGNRDVPSEEIAYQCYVGFHNHALHRQGVQIVAGIDLNLRSAASYSVRDHLGLKISDLPGVAWQLTPFSWAVDYFGTVGDWLDDMFYTLPGTCKYISRAEKYQSVTTSQPFASWGPGFSGAFGGTASLAKYVNFQRYKLAVLPSRALRIKSSDEIASHGLTKFLNLASVLAQKRGPRL